MALNSIGDLSQHFQSLRQTTSIKDRLYMLSNEVTTGTKSDLTAHLNGDVNRLLSLDREIEVMEHYKSSANEASQVMALMQNSLEALDALRIQQAEQSLAITESTARPILNATADSAEERFTEMVATLNRRSGDRSLFAGIQTDGAALASAADMLDDMVASVPAPPTVENIRLAVENWFADPIGGFETVGFIGSNEPIEVRVSQNQSVGLNATAADDGIKQVLKAMATGAIAGRLSSGLSNSQYAELIQNAGVDLLSSATDLNALRGRLGTSESIVMNKIAEQEAQLTAFSTTRNNMVNSDPFETAVRLQEVQQQLETHFAVTARISGLSLANYL